MDKIKSCLPFKYFPRLSTSAELWAEMHDWMQHVCGLKIVSGIPPGAGVEGQWRSVPHYK